MAKGRKYTLVGVDGNAYCVMGYVTNAMRECRFSREEISGYMNDAMSADYNNLLAVSADMVERCNSAEATEPFRNTTKCFI